MSNGITKDQFEKFCKDFYEDIFNGFRERNPLNL